MGRLSAGVSNVFSLRRSDYYTRAVCTALSVHWNKSARKFDGYGLQKGQ